MGQSFDALLSRHSKRAFFGLCTGDTVHSFDTIFAMALPKPQADGSLDLTCARCGKQETFYPDRFSDETGWEIYDRGGDGSLSHKCEGWFWPTWREDVICLGCTTEADIRDEIPISCMRCGKPKIEENEEANLAENTFSADPEASILVCNDCYTDEDYMWGLKSLAVIRTGKPRSELEPKDWLKSDADLVARAVERAAESE